MRRLYSCELEGAIRRILRACSREGGDRLDPAALHVGPPCRRSLPKRAVELRPLPDRRMTSCAGRKREIPARLAQDLIGLPEFAVLASRRLHARGHLGRHARPLARIDLGLLHPFVQCLRRAADLGGDRSDRSPSGGMLMLAIQNQPDRLLAQSGETCSSSCSSGLILLGS